MRCRATNAIMLMTWFGGSIHIEGVHPLEAGLFRYKYRRDRRPGFPVEPMWKFYPSYAWESISKLARWFGIYAGLRLKYMRVRRDPHRLNYMDTALTPVTEDDQDTLELFHETRPVTRPAPAVAAVN